MASTKLNIGKIPISKGEYQKGTAYQRLNQVTMLGSTYQSKIDDNTSAPAQMGADESVENINTDKWLCVAVGNVSAAKKVVYNNETSGLEAGNVQEAIDETNTKLSDLSYLAKRSEQLKNMEDFSIVDAKGNIGFGLDEIGNILLKRILSSMEDFSIVDAKGNIGFQISLNGDIKTKEKRKNIDCLIPPYLFTVINYCYGDSFWNTAQKRVYPMYMYIDRLIKVENNIAPKISFQNGMKSLAVVYSEGKELSASEKFKTTLVTIELSGNDYIDTKINFPLIVSRNDNLVGKKINVMSIGDSETDHDEYTGYLRKLALMDNIDYKKKKKISEDSFDIIMNGTITFTKHSDFTYREEHVNVKNYNEGRSSWAAFTYLHHVKCYTHASVTYNNIKKSVMFCAWHELGLYEKLGREYKGNIDDLQLIANTCNGQYEITSKAIDGWVWNNNRSMIGYENIEYTNASSSQINEMVTFLSDTLLKNPEKYDKHNTVINPFYSLEKVKATANTDFPTAFSWDAYYSRYKTHDKNGKILSILGSAASPDDMHVSVPDYFLINLGTNDNIIINAGVDKIINQVFKLAELINKQTGSKVILFTPANTFSYYGSAFEDKDLNLTNLSDIANINTYWERTKLLMEKCGSLERQEQTGIYFCPTYFIQGLGNYTQVPLTRIGEEQPSCKLTYVQDVHPSALSYDDWAYQLYSMINYLER